jgi:hypothetical protein
MSAVPDRAHVGIDVPSSINDHRAHKVVSQFSRIVAHVIGHEWRNQKLGIPRPACAMRLPMDQI